MFNMLNVWVGSFSKLKKKTSKIILITEHVCTKNIDEKKKQIKVRRKKNI